MPQIGQLGQYQACASQANPSNTDYEAFSIVWESQFRCSLNDTDTIPPCPEDVSERVFECRCTGNENFADLPPDVRPECNLSLLIATVATGQLHSGFRPGGRPSAKFPAHAQQLRPSQVSLHL